MKLLLLSDIHLSTETPMSRIDDFEKTQWDKLTYVFQRALQEDAVIVQAGDLCHQARNWKMCHRLAAFLSIWKVPFYMVRGQHDTYMRSETSPSVVLVLAKVGLVRLLDRSTVVSVEGLGDKHPKIALVGVEFGKNPPLPTPKTGPRILIIHAPIADIPIPGMPEFVDAKKFADKHREYDLILCGDIHRHFCFQTKHNIILNTGPMVRREATEYNFSHQPCFYLYDTDSGELRKEIIPHAPAEQVMERKHLEMAKETEGMMVDFIARVRKTMEEESPGVDVNANFKRIMAKMDLPKTTKELILEVVDATGK